MCFSLCSCTRTRWTQSSLLKLISPLPVLNLDLNSPLFDLLPANFNASIHHLSGLDLPDALRRACQYQIARLEGHDAGHVRQNPRDPEEHQPRRVRLAQLPAHRQLQEGIVRVRDARLGDALRDGQEGVEPFSDRPGQALTLGFVLDVAGRHVDCEDVAFLPSAWSAPRTVRSTQSNWGGGGDKRTINRIHRPRVILRVQIPHRLPHHQAQLHLVVQDHALGAQHGALPRQQDRRRWLQEEEGLLGPGVVQLGDVVSAFRG